LEGLIGTLKGSFSITKGFSDNVCDGFGDVCGFEAGGLLMLFLLGLVRVGVYKIQYG
jgi:hypothetical protein